MSKKESGVTQDDLQKSGWHIYGKTWDVVRLVVMWGETDSAGKAVFPLILEETPVVQLNGSYTEAMVLDRTGFTQAGAENVRWVAHGLIRSEVGAEQPAQPVRKPLTIEQITSMDYRGTLDEHIRAVRMTEAAHGIGTKGGEA